MLDDRVPPQMHQRLHGNPCPLLQNHPLATTLIKHPTGNHDPQILLSQYDDRRGITRPQPADYPDFLSEKRMEPICESHQPELVSSVMMHCAMQSIHTKP